MKKLSYYEDPTVKNTAAHLVEDARQAVEARILRGEVWHAAREAYLAEHARLWVRMYGKDCADMAVRGVCALSPKEWLSKQGHRSAQQHITENLRARMVADGRNSLLNRISLRLIGMPLYAVVLALGGLLLTPHASEAGTRRDRLTACAEAHSDTEQAARRCWQFDAVEKGTYRAYDRAGSPRDWEKPRDWE